MPYFSALCIAYLATALGFARGWGARGRRAMAWSVRGVALVLGVVQAIGLAIWLEQQTAIADGLPLVAEPGWSYRLTLVLTVTTITACLIWLSDEIGRRGIGWGVSLLFFAGLVVGLPGAVSAILEQMRAGAFPISRSRAHTHRRHGHPLQTVPSAGLIERPQEKNRVDALR